MSSNYRNVFETLDGDKTRSYYHRNGDTLEVYIAKLGRLSGGTDRQRCVVLASGPNTPTCIISNKRHFGHYTGQRPPTFSGVMMIWEGLKGKGEQGFELESSVTKSNDNKAPSRRPKETSNSKQASAKEIGGRISDEETDYLLSEDEENDSESSLMEDTSKAGANLSPSSLSRAASGQDDALLVPNQNAIPIHPGVTIHPRRGTTAHMSGPVPEDHQMPRNCREIINSWFMKHSDLAFSSLACTTKAEKSSIIRTRTMRPVKWMHLDGTRLQATMYSLVGTPLSDENEDKRIVVVQGSGIEPMIVSNGGSINRATKPSYKDGAMLVKVWLGVDGDGEGWEKGHSVVRCLEDTSTKSDDDSADELSNHHPKRTARRLDPVPQDHAMPKRCRDAINQWFRWHPDADFNSLPCSTKADSTSISMTRTGKPIVWMHESGGYLDASTYSLRRTSFDDEFGNKKIVVVQGHNLDPTIVSNGGTPGWTSRAVYKDGMLPVRLWLGVDGDSDGWERGHSVLKRTDHTADDSDEESSKAVKKSSAGHVSIRSDPIPRDHEMPERCRNQINDWFRRNATLPFGSLPCTTRTRRSTIYTTDKSKHWISWRLAATGQKLKVATYLVDDTPLESAGYNGRRVIVVEGAGCPPTLVSNGHPNTGGYKDGKMPVRTWIGVGGDREGWEPETTIHKCVEEERPEEAPEDVEIFSAVRDVLPEVYTGLAWPVPENHEMPKQCRDTINEWFSVHPGFPASYPTFATRISKQNILTSNGTTSKLYWESAKTGERLQIEIYNLSNTPLDSGSRDTRIIVVQSDKVTPTIIQCTGDKPYDSTGRRPIKMWVGVKGDSQGWEKGNSVYKCLPKAQHSNVPRVVEEDSDDENDIENTIIATEKRISARQQGRKDQAEQSSRRSHSSFKPAPPAILVRDLRAHLTNNLICLFYSSEAGSPPRARLFSACDTVQKLFAQAIAGDVFHDRDAKAESRILSVRLGGVPAKRMVLAEDDAEDFEYMFDAMTGTGWFKKSDGVIKGSGTIEVRAMV